MKNENSNEELSLSKHRKLAKKKEFAKRKRNAVLTKIIVTLLILAVIGIVVLVIVKDQIKKAISVAVDTDYSEQLDDNGMIKGIKAADYVSIPDYNNITADLREIEYSDESVEKDIDTLLNNKKYLDSSADLIAANGDKVNIDYKGSVDGVEFDGGTAEGADLELGSKSFIDDFEQQIEGHKPGDEFNVEVTFPEDYTNDPGLAGKDAVFAVKLNGIYVKPEFNDAFVQENLSEYASTTEEYRKYLKDTNYEKNLTSFVQKYVVENTTLNSKPEAYLKQLKGNHKSDEYSYYEYMNSMYSTYYGYTPYTSFENYLSQSYSQTEEQYDESIEEKVTDDLKYALFCQAVAEAEGITANYDDAKAYYIAQGGTEDTFESQVTTYGKGYVVQQYLGTKVIKTICERVTVK